MGEPKRSFESDKGVVIQLTTEWLCALNSHRQEGEGVGDVLNRVVIAYWKEKSK